MRARTASAFSVQKFLACVKSASFSAVAMKAITGRLTPLTWKCSKARTRIVSGELDFPDFALTSKRELEHPCSSFLSGSATLAEALVPSPTISIVTSGAPASPGRTSGLA